jgi:serine protease
LPNGRSVAVQEAVAAATVPREPGLPPARFALRIKDSATALQLTKALAELLEPYSPVIRPLSPLSPEILVATLHRRSFGEDAGVAFDAGYALRDATAAEEAEPDLPSGMPGEPDPGQPRVEDAGRMLGCWRGVDPELANRHRWAIDKIKAEKAWAYSEAQGRPAAGRGIVIAHLDTGLTAHPELAGIAQVPGLDLIDGDDMPDDPLDYWGNPGHGTATASVIASLPTGSIVGSAPAGTLMPIRCITSVVVMFPLTVAQAIEEAVARGAHIVTMSLGGAPSFSLWSAVRKAIASDVIVVAAAGNCVSEVVWPARYEDCIAVGGSNFYDKPWRGSCHGPEVAICAPAENVFRATANGSSPNEIAQAEGTSYSVALTAGAAACWLAHHDRANVIRAARRNKETVQALFRRLVRATSVAPDGWNSTAYGSGVIDMKRLLEVDLDFELGREAGTPLDTSDSAASAVAIMVNVGGESVIDRVDAAKPLSNEVAYHLLARASSPESAPKPSRRLAEVLGSDVASKLGFATTRPLGSPAVLDAFARPIDPKTRMLRRRFAARNAAVSAGQHEAAFDLEAVEDNSPIPHEDQVFGRLDPARVDDFLAQLSPEERGDPREVKRALDLLHRLGRPAYGRLVRSDGVEEKLSPDERVALEAVIMTDGSRPTFLLRNGAVDETLPQARAWLDDLVGARQAIKKAARATCRIEPARGGGPGTYFGTGALINDEKGYVLTNFHVLNKILRQSSTLRASGPTPNTFRIFGGVRVDFDGETGSTSQISCRVVEAIIPPGAGQTEGMIDAVLLRIEPGQGFTLPAKVTLSIDTDPVRGAVASLCVIGFPANPGARDIEGSSDIDWNDVISKLFNNRFGLKRLAPGKVSAMLGSIPGPDQSRIFGHDATTLGGSSGSIVFSWRDGGNPGVGLHFRGSLGSQSSERGNSCHAFGPIAEQLRSIGVVFQGGAQ